ncbi:adiponectin receptor protein 1 [Trypanosoma theileri]|uniref:Adiponectin receptor protein 1 n=1 Tax=Trypanosoma theileri TaxID=67003 RepID=A0A1X0P1D6_9TRYP|nr:adiponectin receptor protein 1 [Trypanosoma theileri]ORC90329.1 adiponectin receptor protein 1 [Trypanosoma theileri]
MMRACQTSDPAILKSKSSENRNKESHHHSCCSNTTKPIETNQGKSEQLPLYTRYESCVPEYLKGNPYIITGYRAQYTTHMCIRSLLKLHNETFNIWTHAIGFIVFLVLSFILFITALLFTGYFIHYIVYGVFSFGCLMCMACSTIYHLFSSHENPTFTFITQQMDYYGISILIVASFIPPLYMGFYCDPFFQILYITAICICGSVSLTVLSWPSFSKKDDRCLRTCIYLAMAVTGVVPLVHIFLFYPHNGETLQLLGGIILMFILYSVGVLFYALQIPERWYPGAFDIFLSSHQIWHVFVLAAATVHFFTCSALYQQWEVSRGAC